MVYLSESAASLVEGWLSSTLCGAFVSCSYEDTGIDLDFFIAGFKYGVDDNRV